MFDNMCSFACADDGRLLDAEDEEEYTKCLDDSKVSYKGVKKYTTMREGMDILCLECGEVVSINMNSSSSTTFTCSHCGKGYDNKGYSVDDRIFSEVVEVELTREDKCKLALYVSLRTNFVLKEHINEALPLYGEEVNKEAYKVFQDRVDPRIPYETQLLNFIKSSQVEPVGRRLGKTEEKIDKMTKDVLEVVLQSVDYEAVAKSFQDGQEG
jgi:hypothetical protein